MAIRKAKTDRPATLTRVAKFEIKPTHEQLVTLQRVSDNLWLVWNAALEQRIQYFEEYLQPLYNALKDEISQEELFRYLTRVKAVAMECRAEGVATYLLFRKGRSNDKLKKLAYRQVAIYRKLRAGFSCPSMKSSVKLLMSGLYSRAPDYFTQAAELTEMRARREDYMGVPCPWQQETLKLLDGGFNSFMQLRLRGDLRARPPKEKSPHRFCEIQGVQGFQLVAGNVKVAAQKLLTPAQRDHLQTSSGGCSIVLSPGKTLPGGAMLSFPIPLYQQLLLSQAVKLNKFTIVQDGKGRFWCSIAYAIEKPETVPLVPEEVVFITLGASFIGVVSSLGEETIKLWRPDQYWMPRIKEKKALRDRCAKGSGRWRKLNNAIERDYERLHCQQFDDQRKMIARVLRRHGVHFVIAEHSPIRAKKGRLADGERAERGGMLGLNWSAQNTGSLARLRQLLEQKAAEWGGSVSTLKLSAYPDGTPKEKKVPAARALRAQFFSEVA